MRPALLACVLLTGIPSPGLSAPITFDFSGQPEYSPGSLVPITGWFTLDSGVLTDFLFQTPLSLVASDETNWVGAVYEAFSTSDNLPYLNFYFVNWDYHSRTGGEAVLQLVFQASLATFSGGSLQTQAVSLGPNHLILPSHFECWGCSVGDFGGRTQIPYTAFTSGTATVTVPEPSSLLGILSAVVALGVCRRRRLKSSMRT